MDLERETRLKPPALLLDMDGSLCDVSSIRHYVNPNHPDFPGRKRFDLFHGESHLCPANDYAVRLYRAMSRFLVPLIVTARKEMWAMHTLLWLRDHNIEHERLYMRANDDNRRDVDVKRDILAEIRKEYVPLVAVDDNPSIIALWESEGIQTYTIPGWDQ